MALPIRTPWERYAHVLRHLYDPAERWDLIISGLPMPLRPRAIEAGCDAADVRNPRSARFNDAGAACKQHVLTDHDRFYSPAYLDSVASAIRLRRHQLQPANGATLYVGDNGVLTVVGGEKEDAGYVTSAFRVKPRGVPSHAVRQEDFIRAAVDRMKELTVLGPQGGRGEGP
ncbi:hypothetical protein [Myxococcus sp. RHSTA-1-4]|uniref:hypothetical protein n=1 Tax=Myxococcus sp. RHSTA-1-4 TaxID=2874601 RepID=UPI001CBE978B|nr:hypothetical protein [Myxococcus sp. RHSTA-1-4]MBZ4421771.1 hypothetical protein [Myxococcus sp. RHSTA-1-4]